MSHTIAIILALLAAPLAATAQTAEPPLSIVLPPRLLANAPATLAVLGADGHLAPGVTVDLGGGQRVTTNTTGRASFTAPAAGAFIATASGVSAAALVDASAPPASSAALSVAPHVAQHDGFSICGAPFDPDTSADAASINGDPAFVLAASPICLVVLPQARTLAGPAKLDVVSGSAHLAASTTLVAFDFVPPNPLLLPGNKGYLTVRAEGTADPLRITVENRSPDVLHFVKGETQELRTGGSSVEKNSKAKGKGNTALIEVQAIRSGSFSFRARLLAPSDAPTAVRYLQVAQSSAPSDLQHELNQVISQLQRHPRAVSRPRAVLSRLVDAAPAGTLRILISAARSSL